MPYSEYLDDGIFELRCKQGSNIARVLYFFRTFNLPSTEHVVLLMDLGFEAKGNTPAPRHGEKKALREIVRVL